MIRPRPLVWLLTWLLVLPASAGGGGPGDDLQVYLLIGQSNMAGRAEVTEELAGVIDRCYLLDGEGRWVPAQNPLNRYSTVGKRPEVQKLGPGYGFAVEMLKADPELKLGLVVNARGGTKISQWIGQRSAYYKAAVHRAKLASKTGTLKGVLWHQGEGDKKRHAVYLQKLRTLAGDLRRDLGDPMLPFIAGQIRQGGGGEAINAEIAKLPGVLAFTGVARSEGLTTDDGTHFDTASQLELGRRYAEQMLALLAAAEACE